MPGRLLCVTLAPALDRYGTVAELEVGSVNRPQIVLELAGGKGFNAGRSAAALGVRTSVLALAGGPVGEHIRELAAAEGLAASWIDAKTNTRQCLSLLDIASKRLTEFYEPAQPAANGAWEALLTAFDCELVDLGRTDVVALSRQPPGIPAEALAILVRRCRTAGVQVVIDAYGPELASALAEHPDLIKVNEQEARAIAEMPDQPLITVGRQLLSLGAGAVIVTRGAAGALWVDAAGAVAVEHPPVVDAMAVGSGDAFLGALCVALTGTAVPADTLRHLSEEVRGRMLQVAAAAGMANARQLPAGQISWEAVVMELPSVRLIKQPRN